MSPIFQVTVSSPVGRVRLLAAEDAWIGAYLPRQAGQGPSASKTTLASPRCPAVLRQAARELAQWFCGERLTFSTRLGPHGTPFQRAVWDALRAIPFGERRTYAQVARHVGRPSAARAVGAAIGKNPLSIVVPCHRVVGSDGSLTGYAGGLEAKRWLLAHEGRSADPGTRSPPVSPFGRTTPTTLRTRPACP